MDPITMMLIAQGVAGIGKAGYGAYQKRKGKQALASSFEAPTGTPSEYADLIQQARASDLSQRRIDEINRSMATSTAALQQSGSRGVIGGIGAVTAAGAGAKTQALSQQQQEILQALTSATTGAEYQRRRDVMRQNREQDFAINAIQAGQENIFGGASEAIEAGVSYNTAIQEGLVGDNKTTKDKNVFKGFKIDADADKNAKGITGGPTSKPLTEAQLQEWNKALESYKGFKSGGVQKTPGEFSHSSNPIDIMKDGAKIGEMTGGEYIFNPKQAKQMQKFAKSGSSDLHKFVRTLLNKPQFK